MVVVRGAAGGLLIAMSAALANVALAAQHPPNKGLVNLAFLAVLLGFGLAGFVAGYEATHDIARHGAFAAVVAFVPVEVIAILGRIDRHQAINVLELVILPFLAALAGMFGASFGASVGARRHSSHPGGSSS